MCNMQLQGYYDKIKTREPCFLSAVSSAHVALVVCDSSSSAAPLCRSTPPQSIQMRGKLWWGCDRPLRYRVLLAVATEGGGFGLCGLAQVSTGSVVL